MGAAGKLLAGAAWIYGAQLATVVAQFAYAAVTSRLVGPSAFGAYAIALSVSGLVTLLASGGIAQAVARMDDLEPRRLHALTSFALLVGFLSAAFIWCTSSVWAQLWGDAESQIVIQFLALSSFLAPMIAITTTVLRRHGNFRLLATITLASNILGMTAGVVAVLQFRSGAALAVSAVSAQVLLLLGTLMLTKDSLLGIASIRAARGEILFSSNLTAIKVAEYLVGNIMKFSTSRWLGSAYFGYWNRADMLATLPFQQVQNALLQAVSPEFRHDISKPDRAHRVWTDLLTLVAWLVLPASAVAAVVLPLLLPVLFGPGWEVAALLTTPLAVAGGLQTVSMVLSSAVESLGRFKWMWLTSAVLIGIQLIGAAALIFYENIIAAMVCLIVTQISRHLMQLVLCCRSGYIDRRRLLKSYAIVVVFSALLAGLSLTIASLFFQAPETPPLYLAILSIFISTLLCGWMFRSHLPPVVLARKYGLIPRASRP